MTTTAPEPSLAPPSEPPNRLDRRARTLWRLGDLALSLPLLGVAFATAWGLGRLGFPWHIQASPIVVGLAVAAGLVLVLPELRWRHWRYEIGEAQVDIQHGLVTVTRTLIPIARIQHVETRRGLIERRLGLASIVVYTAAGSSEIPALAADVADAGRDRIAALARTDDDL